MGNIKSLLLASLFVLTTLIANGQGFEWVKAYSGTDRIENMNQIKGSFVDAQGNIYIVGNMSAWGEILGVELLPREINRSAYNRQCVVIAKISPDGQLVWHKPIYSSGYDSYAQALSRMGDTAFMVMCRVSMKHYYDSYPPSSLYFLDTMLTSADEGYLTLKDSTWCSEVSTFFITFDFDGNVREHHILEIGYIDSSGTAITLGVRMNNPSIRYANALCTVGLSHETFTIDHNGNIYVIRNTNDGVYIHGSNDSLYRISVQDGSVSALKIVVDGLHYFTYRVDMPTPMWNQQILKFTPHFDSLIGGTYMFDSIIEDNEEPVPVAIRVYMNVDTHNRLYVNYCAQQNSPRQLYINLDSLYIDARNNFCSVVVYNPDLHPVSLIQLTCDDSLPNSVFGIYDYCMDIESNSLFALISINRGYGAWTSTYLYRSDTIRIPRNKTGLWLRIDMDSYDLITYGFVRTPTINQGMEWGHAMAKDNRLYTQVRFQGLELEDTTLITAAGCWDMAFIVWDYEGHELLHKNYNVASPRNLMGYIHVVDSVVYLTGTLHEDATFDTITLRGTGRSQAYVARYVDTAFMHPYVYHENRDTQTIVWQQGLTHWLGEGRVALTATSTSGLPVSYSYNNGSVAQVRGDTLYFLTAGDVTVTAWQDGNAQYQPARPVSRTFHIDPPEPQSISWTQELDHRLAEGRVALTATATSGLTVSYSCGDNGVALVRGDTLVFLAAGDATVTARQEGDAQYAEAEPVSRTFHIEAPEPQSITWTQELDLSLAEGRVALTATSTSGLPVSYSCSNSGVAQVRGDTLVLLATGTATVTARQEGDARYAAAEPVSKTLRVSAEGIGEASAEGLTLYPNPTTGVVHVGCDGCTVKEATVISALGRREHVACRDGRIDLSHLAAGVYYLEVRTDTGVKREKITKLRIKN